MFCLRVCSRTACLKRLQWGVRFPGCTEGCDSPCGCWELNPDPLEEQTLLSTTEPRLQLLK
ncbi:rCG60760 [Rattus norvegicus]|uniref:RCG60760 n=1 Tax=Rattus norvegicus TaxID=10116 RepID=A6JKU6_RAT|nr:rCG60760 [Rattus norvegicus]